MKFNYSAFKAIYLHEMDRFKRTLMQSLLSPVLSTSLYFIVFGSVIGGYVEKIDGIRFFQEQKFFYALDAKATLCL